ncbi:MAG: VacJ family lipoprotein [Pseudomonadota bacterium]
MTGQIRHLVRIVGVFALMGLAACADPIETRNPDDPYEGFNRQMHAFNVRLDENVIRPVAQGYDAVTPDLAQFLIGNGLSHLRLPRDFANHLFQGEIVDALATLARFGINTVYGAGGLLDPATEFGLPRNSNDFGTTLGKAGVGEGAYLVLPLLGPTTPRDLVGSVVDRAFRPTTYIGIFTAADGVGPGVAIVGGVDARDRNGEFIDDVLYNSPDSYVTLRSFYLQNRRAQVNDGAGDEALPDIFDDEAAPAE